MFTIEFAAHVAYLDPRTGSGLLVRPKPADDLSVGMVSLHAADWDHVIAELDRLGWEPTEDDDGLPMFDGMTTDGREVRRALRARAGYDHADARRVRRSYASHAGLHRGLDHGVRHRRNEVVVQWDASTRLPHLQVHRRSAGTATMPNLPSRNPPTEAFGSAP